jgi:predicted dehydrogenase
MKVGVIGLGWPGQQHVTAVRQLAGEFELAAVCDAAAERLKPFEGQCPVYSDADSLLADPNVEVVVLALPHHLHEPMAVKALEMGKHVLVEKPMARTVEECERMIAAAEKNDRILMVAQNWRFQPWCVAAKHIVQSGELGSIQAVQTEWLLHFHPNFPKGSWIYDGELAGGGAVISLGIHNLDALRFIVGEITEVHARAQYTDDWSSKGAENWAMAQFRFANGAIGQFFTGYTPFNPPETAMLRIYGDRGTLFYGPYEGETALWVSSAARSGDSRPVYERVDLQRLAPGMVEHAQTNQMKHFGECIKQGVRPETDGREVLATMKLVERIYRSARSGTDGNA